MSPFVYTGDVEATYPQMLWGEKGSNYGEVLSDHELSPELRFSAAEILVRHGAVHEKNIETFLNGLRSVRDQYSAQYAAIDLRYENNDSEKIRELHRYTELQSRIFLLESEIIVQCITGRA